MPLLIFFCLTSSPQGPRSPEYPLLPPLGLLKASWAVGGFHLPLGQFWGHILEAWTLGFLSTQDAIPK